MRTTQHTEIYEFLIRTVRLLNPRQLSEYKEQGKDDKQSCQSDIHYRVCWQVPFRRFLLHSEHRLAEEHRSKEGTKTVERLCQVETLRCCLGVTQNGDVWVGRRLKETHTCGYNEEHTEIEPILTDGSSREEQQSSEGCKKQSEDDT